jgi:glycosyltransferase involved in cell wall biosynthesis
MATPRYLPEMGGVERHVYEVATRLAASSEVDVTVLTTDRTGRLAPRERIDEVEIRRVRARPRDRDWLFAPAAAAVVARGAWDVMHVQSYHTLVAPIVMATAARRRLPYVLTFHGGGHSSPLRHRLRVAQRALLRPMLSRAAALVAVAQFEIDEYAAELRLPTKRFALIPNGVDLPAPADHGDGEIAERGSGPLIASVGRLERYKGHQRVLAALPALREVEPQARLWIAGAGPYEPELRRLAASLGLSEAVEISAVPPGDRAQMARRLAQVDIVVLLSSFETHPIAALEALWLGRPVLVATGSGLGELAERGLARAIDPASPPQDVAAAIVRELRDPLPVAPAQLPTWDDCATALLALYRRVLARAP